MEICAIELQTESSKLIILSSYKVSTGDSNKFIKNLDDALKYLYKTAVLLLIFGDVNTDYLIESNQKKVSLIIKNIQSVAHSKFCNKNSK